MSDHTIVIILLMKTIGVGEASEGRHTNHNYRKLVNLYTRTTVLSNSMKLSHAVWAIQGGRVIVERSDKMWSPGEGNGTPLQYSCCRKRDPFQGLKLGSSLRNELSEETHLLTKQEILLGKGSWVKSCRVRKPRRTALPHGLQSGVLW